MANYERGLNKLFSTIKRNPKRVFYNGNALQGIESFLRKGLVRYRSDSVVKSALSEALAVLKVMRRDLGQGRTLDRQGKLRHAKNGQKFFLKLRRALFKIEVM